MSHEQKNKAEQERINENKAWLTRVVERVDVGSPSVDKTGKPIEHGGPSGPEVTRFGDWTRNGLCIDF